LVARGRATLSVCWNPKKMGKMIKYVMPPPRHEPGWHGAFTREQAPGAMASGSRIVKAKSEEGDAHPVGTTGTVLGSLLAPGQRHIGYFIEWDPSPRTAVFVIGWKLRC
jgi:hypothetical protein